ncbi:MAG: nucleotidyl transferase AbiEii/AbiGii toxin family protein [Elusimicrobiota bacterium]|jgi:predicted nucleotidyltransferase component of viral defense system|nr:nucleotidyl transferase AbiEii/AbiGii toxin family protein [Elusimicrobiota bacterium]
MTLLHKNTTKFLEILNAISKNTNFEPTVLEKDYYLTIVLAKTKELSPDLIFKGGTSINKIYYPYHRMSEDLNFNLRFRAERTKEERRLNQSNRKTKLTDIEKNIDEFMKQFDLIREGDLQKNDNSRQYSFVFRYNSVITNATDKIKFEIRSRENDIILPTELRIIKHNFINPFTKESLIETKEVKTLALIEILADKLAAAVNRNEPRDFYDIDYAIQNKFDFTNKDFIKLFQSKLRNDKNDADISKYRHSLNLNDNEIIELKKRVPDRLEKMLTKTAFQEFNVNTTLQRIDAMMEEMIAVKHIQEVETEMPGIGG